MILAALLILVGICMILIALLVLRFTLLFTMEEEYREIGIMKAIGLRDKAIRRLYLVKYTFLVSSGAFLGLLISVPISCIMVARVSVNMIMEDSGVNFFVNILCTLLIIFLVMLYELYTKAEPHYCDIRHSGRTQRRELCESVGLVFVQTEISACSRISGYQ